MLWKENIWSFEGIYLIANTWTGETKNCMQVQNADDQLNIQW